MNDFEYLESIGQMNIYDYLEITPSSYRNKSFEVHDLVKIRFYQDEINYITKHYPELLDIAIVVKVNNDVYNIKLSDGRTIEISGEKLTLL